MKPSSVFRICALLSMTLITWSARPSAAAEPLQSKLYEARACNPQMRALCQENECACTRWIIEWRTPSGTVWGITEGKTRESVEKQRDRDILFETSFANFFQQPFDANYSNPSAPICDSCFPEAMNPTDASRAAMSTAALLYDELTRKAQEALPSFIRGVFLPHTTVANSPLGTAGRAVLDYSNAFRDVLRKQKRMRQDLMFTQHEGGRLYGSLQGSIRELQLAAETLDSTYRRLPQSVLDAMAGKSSVGDTIAAVDSDRRSSAAINQDILGRWKTKYGSNGVEVQKNGDQIVVVLYNSNGKVLQSFSGKAIVDKYGELRLQADTPGNYSYCSISTHPNDVELDMGCVDAKDPTSGSLWSAVKDR